MTGNVAEVRPERVNSIQVLRFAAAFLVVLGHVQHEAVKDLRLPERAWHAARLVDWGLGVDIFFVISGFVMYHMTQRVWGARGMALDFLRRRILRVAPPYWAFTALVVAIGVVGHTLTVPRLNILFSFLFLPGPSCPDYCVPVYTLGWSLNFELLFYAVFTICLLLPRRAGLVCLGAILLSLMVIGQLVPYSWTLPRTWGDPIIGEFAFGVGLAILHGGGAGNRFSRRGGWTMVVLGVAVAILAWRTAAFRYLWRLWTGGVPALLIVGGATLALEPKRDGAWLRFLIAGGDASYALYLSHPFVAKLGLAVADRSHLLVAAPTAWVMIIVAATIVTALLLHRYLERPILRALTRRLSRFGSGGLGDGVPAVGTLGRIVPPTGG